MSLLIYTTLQIYEPDLYLEGIVMLLLYVFHNRWSVRYIIIIKNK